MRIHLITVLFFFITINLNAQEVIGDTLIGQGQYSDGVPDGNWTFSRKSLKADEKAKLVDYRYVTTLSGIEDNILGQFKNGKPSGPWTLNRVQIENSILGDTLFKSSIKYEDGIPTLSVKLENVRAYLIARFLRDGFAHDEWSLFLQDELESSEEWSFSKGILNEVRWNGTSYEVFSEESPEFAEMPLNEDYLTIIKLNTPELNDSDVINLFSVQDDLLSDVESSLNASRTSVDLRTFRVKVPVYEKKEEVVAMQSYIVGATEEARRIADGILSNSQLNIAKLSDPKTSFQFNSAEKINERFLIPLGLFEEFVRKGISNHVPMQKIMSHLFPDGMPPTSFQVNVSGGSPKIFESGLELSTGALPSLSDIQKLASFSLATLTSLKNELSNQASIVIRASSILSEEELLVEKAKDFQKVLDGLKTTANEQSIGVLDHINVFSDERLTEYAKMEDSEEKLEAAKKLEACYEHLTALAIEVSDVNSDQEELEEIYMDEVWNPFTLTLMDERVKRRILNAYENVLVPSMLNDIKEGLSCDSAKELSDRFTALYDRMIVLRDIKTKKLERKLKRKKDPEEILSILGLENF